MQIQLKRIGALPKWPMSAYSASPPVTRQEHAGEHGERADLVLRDQAAARRVGSSATSTPGSRTIQLTPITARIANQPSMTGPNTLPTEPVPCLWITNSPTSTDEGDRQNGNLRIRCGHVQAFDGAQYRYRGRDGAVGRRTAPRPGCRASRKASCAGSARSVLTTRAVSASTPPSPLLSAFKHDRDVLEQDDENQRPEDQRQHAEDMLRRHRDVRAP